MKVNIDVTSFEADPSQNRPALSKYEGEIVLTDDDLLRLAQVLFTAAAVSSSKFTPREGASSAKTMVEELRKIKLVGRQTKYNDDALAEMRAKHQDGKDERHDGVLAMGVHLFEVGVARTCKHCGMRNSHPIHDVRKPLDLGDVPAPPAIEELHFSTPSDADKFPEQAVIPPPSPTEARPA